MRISVDSGGKPLVRLALPSGLVFNRFFAPRLLPRILEENGIHISGEDVELMVKAICDYKKKHPQWVLVEVDSPNGERVRVKF